MPFADASFSEEPGAVVPHAGIRAGSVGQLAGLPRWRFPFKDVYPLLNSISKKLAKVIGENRARFFRK